MSGREDGLQISNFGLLISTKLKKTQLASLSQTNFVENKKSGAGGGTRTPTSIRKTDFHTSYDFRRLLNGVCGLDYPFTIALALGAARLVSTPSKPYRIVRSSLARDYQFKGFPEFEQFYIHCFQGRTQKFKSVASTDSATPAHPRVYQFFPISPTANFRLSSKITLSFKTLPRSQAGVLDTDEDIVT